MVFVPFAGRLGTCSARMRAHIRAREIEGFPWIEVGVAGQARAGVACPSELGQTRAPSRVAEDVAACGVGPRAREGGRGTLPIFAPLAIQSFFAWLAPCFDAPS